MMSKTISREQIQDRLAKREPMILVEALPAQYFAREHLPGAVNIPHDQIRQQAPVMLPDKDAFIVVYCANTECQNSKVAANTLHMLGYVNAFEYVEGKQHWLEARLPVESTR
jgi:rhodanese-related sulfurtransferase